MQEDENNNDRHASRTGRHVADILRLLSNPPDPFVALEPSGLPTPLLESDHFCRFLVVEGQAPNQRRRQKQTICAESAAEDAERLDDRLARQISTRSSRLPVSARSRGLTLPMHMDEDSQRIRQPLPQVDDAEGEGDV